jgi:hypothetical protein
VSWDVEPYDRARFSPQSKAYTGACSARGCYQQATKMRLTGNVRRKTYQALCDRHVRPRLSRQPSQPTDRLRDYVVTIPLRGSRSVLVQAKTADEAVQIVNDGGGRACDADLHRSGRPVARLDGGR